jgi:hypothetical protein
VTDELARFLAAALYEMRVLLQTYSGDDECVRLAERLAYAVHNDALSVIEGDGTFDVAASRHRIQMAEELVDATFPDGFGLLREQAE